MKTMLLQGAIVFAALTEVYGQANLRIAINPATNGIVVSWLVQSLVPSPGSPGFASYRVFTSTNLTDWSPATGVVNGFGVANQHVQVTLADLPAKVFAKVESILDFSGLEFVARALMNAKFARGIFVGSDFFGADLTGSDFSDARIEAASFRRATLSAANLARSEAMGTDFSNANLDDVNAEGADLSYCDFTSARLNGANLSGADLRSSTFAEASINFLALHRSLIDEHTILPPTAALVWKMVNGQSRGASITNDLLLCDLRGADLEGCKFGPNDLRGSDLRNANLKSADLTAPNLLFADWRGVQIDDNTRLSAKSRLIWELSNQDATGRDLVRVDLSNAALVEARLAAADLNSAILNSAILIGADLHGAKMRGAQFQRADLTRANLQNADLTGAPLDRADLSEANLTGAVLTSSSQVGTIFRNTIMPDGTVRN